MSVIYNLNLIRAFPYQHIAMLARFMPNLKKWISMKPIRLSTKPTAIHQPKIENLGSGNTIYLIYLTFDSGNQKPCKRRVD